MVNFGLLKSEARTAAIIHERMAAAGTAPFDSVARKRRAERWAWKLRVSQGGLGLLGFLLLLTPELHGQSAKVNVKEGKIPPESIQRVYQIALDQVSVSHPLREAPKLDVYFVTNLAPERFGQGRVMRWTVRYPREKNQPDERAAWDLEEAALVMRKGEPWELWSESSNFGLLFTALVGALDYANQLYLDEEGIDTMRAAGLSQWMCETGRSCDWQLLANREKKISFLKKRASPR